MDGFGVNFDGCMIEVLRAGTVSGVGIAPPVAKATFGSAAFRGGLFMPPFFCFAIW